MKLNNIQDAGIGIGKYNLKNDPVCLEIIGRENMDKIFRGEACSFPDFPVPVQDLVDRGVVAEKPYEAATMDMFMLPIWDGGIFVCTICFAIVKKTYQDRTEISKAQEYMDQNWSDDYDIEKIAKAANFSVHHLPRIFKNHTGISPYEYYKQVKIDKIKEKLRDPNLNITQAFAACGVESTGTFFRYFKESANMTPSEYREQNIRKK